MKTVIIPTLNEEENIGKLIRLIFQNIGSEGVQIIVVDDNSKDGTHSVVHGLQSEFKGVKLLIRTKERGLSTAVRYGAEHAGDSAVVVMDADLSHHPRFLNSIFEKLDSGYDIPMNIRRTRIARTTRPSSCDIFRMRGFSAMFSLLMSVAINKT